MLKIILFLSAGAFAEWSHLSVTAVSQRGEDPGPRALAMCRASAQRYAKTCRASGKSPTIWGCAIQGYAKNPSKAYAATRVKCD